jgi:hypothetical protein
MKRALLKKADAASRERLREHAELVKKLLIAQILIQLPPSHTKTAGDAYAVSQRMVVAINGKLPQKPEVEKPTA